MIDKLARVRDADLHGAHTSPAAAALRAAIVAGDATPGTATRDRRRVHLTRRLALAAAVVVAVTGTAVLGPGLWEDRTATSYANSAIEISREGDSFVARIKDPLAERARFREAFRAVGKNVDIVLVPVPAAMIGDLLEMRGEGGRVSSDLIPPDDRPVDCRLTPTACVLEIRVAVAGDAAVTYTFGRAARPGETETVPDQGPATDGPSPRATGD